MCLCFPMCIPNQCHDLVWLSHEDLDRLVPVSRIIYVSINIYYPLCSLINLLMYLFQVKPIKYKNKTTQTYEYFIQLTNEMLEEAYFADHE